MDLGFVPLHVVPGEQVLREKMHLGQIPALVAVAHSAFGELGDVQPHGVKRHDLEDGEIDVQGWLHIDWRLVDTEVPVRLVVVFFAELV